MKNYKQKIEALLKGKIEDLENYHGFTPETVDDMEMTKEEDACYILGAIDALEYILENK